MRFLLAACCLPFSFHALAEEIVVPIEKQDWKITMNTPPLAKKMAREVGANFVFQANSGRFNLSFFVEPPAKEGGNKECYEHYWPLAKRNPIIDQATVKASNTESYYRVGYDVTSPTKGATVTQRNVNYYFAFAGKWIDVHVSIIDPQKGDEEILAAFEKGLKYGK